MFKRYKTLAFLLCLAFIGSTICEQTYSQRRGSSRSSRPSSSSSKPSFSSPSSRKPSSGSRKPSSGFSSPSSNSNKPATSSNSSNSNFSSPSSRSGQKAGTSSRPPTTSSRKPVTSSSAKSRAASQAQSKRKYVESKKATAPPKPSYTTKDGKTVNVRKDSSAVQQMRSRPSTYYQPSVRVERHTTYISSHGYGHPYSYYHSQPYYHVGGGYSSAFWYMMSEWSAERRARWLYHNRSNIDSSAYQRGVQDAEVQARLTALETGGTAPDPDYVDPELADDPDLQYSQEYVEAAYNPQVVPARSGSSAGSALLWVFVIFVGVIAIWFVMTKLRWGR